MPFWFNEIERAGVKMDVTCNSCKNFRKNIFDRKKVINFFQLDLRFDPLCGGPVVIILATGSEVRGFKPGGVDGFFSERKNPEYDFLLKGSKAVGPVS